MINFYLMILIQCAIVGIALCGYLRFSWFAIKAKTWGERISFFIVAQLFICAAILIGVYWYDTIETNNTLFSTPIHKTVEMNDK